jgi:hypothetical protein
MTEDEYLKEVAVILSTIEALVGDAAEKLTGLIRAGTPAGEAARQVLDEFGERFEEALGEALTEITGTAIDAPGSYQIGGMTLSQRLYAHAEATATVVEGVVAAHANGFQDARKLALELYEGYGFNPAEPLVINPEHDAIPKYMREALLTDESVRRDLARAYAKAQTKALRTGALRSAYAELLQSIDKVADGSGADYLDKKLEVAVHEKMRYYASRISRTELHRAYARRQAGEIMQDQAVKFVQWRMTPNHPAPDICDAFAGADYYGLGPGIYPKDQAPVAPAHPHCRCILVKKTSLRNAVAGKYDAGADLRYLGTLNLREAAQVAGSKAKLEAIQNGRSAWEVHNAGTDPLYQVKTVGEVVDEG